MKTQAVRKQQSNEPKGKIQKLGTDNADKEANETVLKETRSQGEQEVTPRLVLHSADVLTASWFTTVTQNTFDAESTKKHGAEKRNEVQEAA